MAQVTCKVCKKKIEKELAFTVKKGYYVCSEDEWLEAVKVKEARKDIIDLFNVKLTTGTIMMLNKNIKSIIDNHSNEVFIQISKETVKIMGEVYIPNDMSQSQKAKYIIAIMNNNLERVVDYCNNVEVNKNMELFEFRHVKKENKNDISRLLELI